MRRERTLATITAMSAAAAKQKCSPFDPSLFETDSNCDGRCPGPPQAAVCSEISRASFTSMPRYLTVLSSFVWPSRRWMARRFLVRRYASVVAVRRSE